VLKAKEKPKRHRAENEKEIETLVMKTHAGSQATIANRILNAVPKN